MKNRKSVMFKGGVWIKRANFLDNLPEYFFYLKGAVESVEGHYCECNKDYLNDPQRFYAIVCKSRDSFYEVTVDDCFKEISYEKTTENYLSDAILIAERAIKTMLVANNVPFVENI